MFYCQQLAPLLHLRLHCHVMYEIIDGHERKGDFPARVGCSGILPGRLEPERLLLCSVALVDVKCSINDQIEVICVRV